MVQVLRVMAIQSLDYAQDYSADFNFSNLGPDYHFLPGGFKILGCVPQRKHRNIRVFSS